MNQLTWILSSLNTSNSSDLFLEIGYHRVPTFTKSVIVTCTAWKCPSTISVWSLKMRHPCQPFKYNTPYLKRMGRFCTKNAPSCTTPSFCFFRMLFFALPKERSDTSVAGCPVARSFLQSFSKVFEEKRFEENENVRLYQIRADL